MWLFYRGEGFNLGKYHRIFPTNKPARITIEICAGGAQEGNGRQFYEFDTEDERDEIYDLISAALATGAPAFDIEGHYQALEEGLVMPLEPSPLLDMAWKVISNAYGGAWEDANEEWQEIANQFRDIYFNRNKDDA